MLTVNIKSIDTESIFEVSEVNAHSSKVGGLIDVINVTMSDGGIRVIEHCDVYVMSNGKTVAKYLLMPDEKVTNDKQACGDGDAKMQAVISSDESYPDEAA